MMCKEMTFEQKQSLIAIARKKLTFGGVEILNESVKENIIEDFTTALDETNEFDYSSC